ncbi:MAG: SPFH domain-containing protein [Tidjanibacter sp.]|nr:SPFH domain-containing protein [Tidjanibacter sp.]
MENKEYKFSGFRMSGFAGLIMIFAILGLSIWSFVADPEAPLNIILGSVGITLACIMTAGFRTLEPNQARAMVFFGKYKGTFTDEGFWWTNPFYTAKAVSFRARNLNADAIKVNDKTGNPIMIGLVVVWRVKDTYKALFEIDSQTMVSSVKIDKKGEVEGVGALAGRMMAFENFVRVQSDAALRQVAGMYAYDNNGTGESEPTLRSGADEINELLCKTINERLSIAGIEAVEARINYLAYAPEIAAVMLRRQQADAIISAREKIVEGAVSMVHMALDKLKAEGVVELDEERKAAMVSNLLVVLCADESAQPVVNTGSLYN